MPGGDGTGPLGNGPRTGRGWGFCGGGGQGGWPGMGRRRGWRFGWGSQAQQGEAGGTGSWMEMLTSELKAIHERLTALEGGRKEEPTDKQP
ncbi:MAG: DUF5320 family protein [Elusimicrobiota bacterium]